MLLLQEDAQAALRREGALSLEPPRAQPAEHAADAREREREDDEKDGREKLEGESLALVGLMVVAARVEVEDGTLEGEPC